MRSTSAMSTPMPIIKRPPAAALSRDQPCSTRSDYTGRAAMPTNTMKTSRGVRGKEAKRASGSEEWTGLKAGDLQILQATALAKIPWLVHGFSTRPGGVSDLGGKKVLNLGFAEWDTK